MADRFVLVIKLFPGCNLPRLDISKSACVIVLA